MPAWDPQHYLQYADERSRPFVELSGRIGATAPESVLDLGCGPGNLTALLADRWPDADVLGIDSSAPMIAAAAEHSRPRLRFEVGDVRDQAGGAPVDVIISNATLQWVPDHRRLLPGLVDRLTPGGWFAFQVPGNHGEPSHTLLHELAADPRFAAATAGIEPRLMPPAAQYLTDLAALGCRTDAWETTYLHVLAGADPVFDWISGTGARPVLQALDAAPGGAGLRKEFEAEYKALLRKAYPRRPHGTVLPFRRIFAVAQKPA